MRQCVAHIHYCNMTFKFDIKVNIYMVYDMASCWATSSLPFKVPKVLVNLLCVKNFIGYTFFEPLH